MNRPGYILPIIIFAQFAGTSLWFAANAVVVALQNQYSWAMDEQALADITSAVQLGFIAGTLTFAFLALADRFSPRRVFFYCTIAGASANILVLLTPESLSGWLIWRFITGFFLAGIYPVGMRIVAAWYKEGLGRALGYLVGAVVLGTAFPHLLRAIGTELPWQQVIIGVSVLALCGGLAILMLVPDGPHLPKGARFNPRVFALVFRSRSFRASAFGYFGHMWELYALWAFIPVWLLAYAEHAQLDLNVSLWSFTIIALGFVGCVGGGLLSIKTGSARVAAVQLLVSGLCCLLSPLFFYADIVLLMIFLAIWGITVAGDSPQFSTLNAETAPREYVGSALTIVNCIGFLITVVSIQLLSLLLPIVGPQLIFWLLIPGPILGLFALKPHFL